jgi:uncharacterized membrane protein
MIASGGKVNARAFAVELDVLRGLAAVLMILNHSGFRLLSPDDVFHSVSATAVFLGGMAPVLFFFATGFGIALSAKSPARPFDLPGLVWKTVLLVLADQFFFWGKDVAWGIDFFSFIAISTVVVSVIARFKAAIWVCATLIFALIFFRYGVGDALQPWVRNHDFAVWLLGRKGIVDISYPLSPWLVYPLIGFILGSFYGSVSPRLPQPRNRWIQVGTLLAMLSLAAALAMHHDKAIFFRWGSMTLGYFVLSLSVLFASAVLALFVVMRSNRLSAWISLRGVASFAVIPLHYAMLDTATKAMSFPQPQWVVALLTLGILTFSFVLSNFFASVASGPWVAARKGGVSVAAAVVVIACVTTAVISMNYQTVPIEVSRFLGQLSIAVLLGLGIPKRSSIVR